MKTILTSESVTCGHPDKVCDQISDAILDAILAQDPEAHVACEVTAWTDNVNIMGEVTAAAHPDYEAIARRVIRDIGYDKPGVGFDAGSCLIHVNLHTQSPDIAKGVDHKSQEDTGAGDQGMMFGYACRETEDLMPLPITLAVRLAKRLEQVRREGVLPWLLPDGKSQVSVEYEDGKPVRIATVVISAQHSASVPTETLREAIRREVIDPALPEELVDDDILRLGLNTYFVISEKKDMDLRKIKAAFEFKIADLAGFCPDLSCCRRCGITDGVGMNLDVMNGGLVCSDCKRAAALEESAEDTGTAVIQLPLTDHVLAVLRYITSVDEKRFLSFRIPEEELPGLAFVCERYLLDHLGHGFHSLDFYKSILV